MIAVCSKFLLAGTLARPSPLRYNILNLLSERGAVCEMRHRGFAPVADGGSKVLVLGTFPGRASREARQYYGHPRNQFWSILYAAFGEAFDCPGYPEKLRFLLAHGVALWDVVESCETEGSLDTEIRAPSLIDLPAFLREHPGVRRVCFNGGNAARYAKSFGPLPAESLTLPSTSPANARYSFAHKRELWARALRMDL